MILICLVADDSQGWLNWQPNALVFTAEMDKLTGTGLVELRTFRNELA